MAIGNLLGSNLFNIFTVSRIYVFYFQGRSRGIIDPASLMSGMLDLLVTSMGLIGNLDRLERRVLLVELDSLALLPVYFSGLWLLYSCPITPFSSL